MDGSCGVGQMGSAAAAAQGRGGEGRVAATNIGRLRCAARQGKVRGGVTSWHLRVFAVVVGAMGCLLLAASLMMSAVHQVQFRNGAISRNIRGLQENIVRKEQAEQIMHGRLLHMATSVVTKNKSDGENFALWEEPYKQARKWKPCAAKHSYPDEGPSENNNGFILVSANGGLNWCRVAVCNAVVVAALLNATLALPRFLYSSVWKDKSQFGDIYQEDYFVNYMKSDVHIVKDLPPHLQSLDLEAIGSQITDMDIMKEAEPSELIKSVLPILWENGIVHFLGFGNRLGFDSVPIHLQDCFAGTSTIFGRFSYKEMKKATRNFSMVLGGGENGTIFKGQLSDGSVVAIRRIESSPKQGQLEFCKEMELLGRLHHRHLVGLKGFCLTRFERFQVYEYMENGSLKDHLHSSGKRLLPWKNRIQIAIDVANALEYLHFYCDPPLYHGDIKPSNVLLDRNYLAKLAGCGIAHCSSGGNTTVSSTPVNVKIQATAGYVDPEYVVTQELTPKSDVYSYGVLLLELVTGKPVVQGSKSLVEWSRELIGTDYRLHELVDPAVADAFDLDELQVMADVIHWCTHRDGGARPSMKQVLRILYERLDPLSGGLARAVESEEGYYYGGGHSGRQGKEGQEQGLQRGGDAIQFSGEARCLPSSSSTSRSYCSRSVLLECNSPEPPQSPHGHGAFLV